MARKNKNDLTPSQQHFADEWLIDHNGGRAYKAAYPRVKKDATAMQAASRLLRNVKVRAFIKTKQAKMAAKYKIDRERVFKEESCIAFSDISKLFKGGQLLPPDKLPESTQRAIKTFKCKEFPGGVKVSGYTFWDKNRALDRLYKHLGMFERENKQKRPSMAELFEALRQVSPELAEAVRVELKK